MLNVPILFIDSSLWRKLVRMDVMTEQERQEVTKAVYNLSTEFRYEYEGPRDSDSIESFIDNWLEKYLATSNKTS